jgi:hypothetical protein
MILPKSFGRQLWLEGKTHSLTRVERRGNPDCLKDHGIPGASAGLRSATFHPLAPGVRRDAAQLIRNVRLTTAGSAVDSWRPEIVR